MNFYTTELDAIDPADGELKRWQGPNIPAIGWNDAEQYCQEHGFGYLRVTGQLIAEIGTKVDENGFIVVDMNTKIDYDNLN